MQANISHSRKIFDRLVEAAQSRGESLPTLSQKLGMHLSSFYRWKKGSMPHDRTIRQVAEILRIRESWLRDGDEPMCEPAAARLQTVTEGDAAKETAASHRLEQPSTVFRSRIPLQSPTPGHHALEAITAKLSNSEMEETILTTVTKLREEGPPLMKLGYITTLRACVDEIERRLVASADD